VSAVQVYVSVDMEGATGVTHQDDVTEGAAGYEQGRVLVSGNADAAVRGAFDAGATQVLVNDAHSRMRNLLHDRIDPRAHVIRGFDKPLCMMAGIDADFDAAVFIGYHARAGTAASIMSHTLLGHQLTEPTLNGKAIGEIELSALIAGSFDVPVCLVSGDDHTCQEASAALGPHVETVAVKRGLDRFVAECRSPAETSAAIYDGVARSIGAREAVPLRGTLPLVFGVEFISTTIAATCALLPDVGLRVAPV